MFRARRVDVLNMTHLLKLAAGDEALKFHRGSMRIYKGGFYSAIGDIAPEHLLAHCAVFSQTLEGLLLLIGYTGVRPQCEPEVYTSAKDAYGEAIMMVMVDKNNAPDKDGNPGNAQLVDADGQWPVEEREVFSILRNISAGERNWGRRPHLGRRKQRICVGSWAILYIWLWSGGGESSPNTSNI